MVCVGACVCEMALELEALLEAKASSADEVPSPASDS